MTLHDSFTTDDVVDCTYGPDIHFMRQTFDCTREAAKELQTRLELLITIRETEDQVLSLPEFSRVIPEYEAWIGSFKSLKDSDRQYLECVSEYM